MNIDINKLNEVKWLVENNRKYSPWTKSADILLFSKELIDESKEVCQAVENNDLENLKEELGDVLFDIFMLLQICEEKHGFNVNDSMNVLIEKFKRRKPHIYEERHVSHDEEHKVWHDAKAKEKLEKSKSKLIPITINNQNDKENTNQTISQKLSRIIIHTDGGSRGNPGNAAIGIVILDEKNNLIDSYKGRIGVATNNVAEYSAVIKALELAKKYTNDTVSLFSDSELTVRQLNGEYKIKQDHLQKLYNNSKINEKCFKKVIYTHVRREHPNQSKADALVNQALDGV